jgi:hypothetical protein
LSFGARRSVMVAPKSKSCAGSAQPEAEARGTNATPKPAPA